jgi:adenine-specific DNA-methyltransferase
MNNPPVGLVTPETDPPLPTHKAYDYVMPVPSVPSVGRAPSPAKYDYDPHLDPQLVWAGKKEHTSFDVHTVSLHVHERIDPSTIIEAVRRQNGNGLPEQPSLFERREENPPFRDAVDFYKHPHGWSNRLIAGDSLLVMNSLLEKEGMAGQVQMVYIDPPYGIKYGSNFQPFVNKRDVKDGRDEDLTQEPEMVRAFRDTWELGVHSYLTYLRDRLLLSRELLHDSGSCFVQIGDENLHHITELMDDVFGTDNRVSVIPFRKKTMPLGAKTLEGMCDFLVWYSRNRGQVKYRGLYVDLKVDAASRWTGLQLADGTRRKLTKQEADRASLPAGASVYRLVSQRAPTFTPENVFDFKFQGKKYPPPQGGCWVTTEEGMSRLAIAERLEPEGDNLSFLLLDRDFPYAKLNNLWFDTVGASDRSYVVQTSAKVLQRCLLMTTDPGDLVLDPTCGSGTTAYVAEQWGRRWITCDTSRVAVTLAKQRLMTADFDYYELLHPGRRRGQRIQLQKSSARDVEVDCE